MRNVVLCSAWWRVAGRRKRGGDRTRLAGPDRRHCSALTPHTTMNDMRSSTGSPIYSRSPAGHVAASPSSHPCCTGFSRRPRRRPRPIAPRLHLLAGRVPVPDAPPDRPCLGGPLLPPALKNQAPRPQPQLSLPAEPSRLSFLNHAQALQTVQRWQKQGQSSTHGKLPPCEHTAKHRPL